MSNEYATVIIYKVMRTATENTVVVPHSVFFLMMMQTELCDLPGHTWSLPVLRYGCSQALSLQILHAAMLVGTACARVGVMCVWVEELVCTSVRMCVRACVCVCACVRACACVHA